MAPRCPRWPQNKPPDAQDWPPSASIISCQAKMQWAAVIPEGIVNQLGARLPC